MSKRRASNERMSTAHPILDIFSTAGTIKVNPQQGWSRCGLAKFPPHPITPNRSHSDGLRSASRILRHTHIVHFRFAKYKQPTQNSIAYVSERYCKRYWKQRSVTENNRIRCRSLSLARQCCCDVRCSLNLWFGLRLNISQKILIECKAMIPTARKTSWKHLLGDSARLR